MRNNFWQLNCCGVHSSSDYKDHSIPASCCNVIKNQTCSISDTFTRGCVEALKDTLTLAGTVFGSVAIAVAGVEVSLFYILFYKFYKRLKSNVF